MGRRDNGPKAKFIVGIMLDEINYNKITADDFDSAYEWLHDNANVVGSGPYEFIIGITMVEEEFDAAVIDIDRIKNVKETAGIKIREFNKKFNVNLDPDDVKVYLGFYQW